MEPAEGQTSVTGLACRSSIELFVVDVVYEKIRRVVFPERLSLDKPLTL